MKQQLPLPFHLNKYKIVPAHKRTVYFYRRFTECKKYKFTLNIPEMLVGFNFLKTYYFPVKVTYKDIYQQYFSPFTNTHGDGSICMGNVNGRFKGKGGDHTDGYLDDLLKDIYNSVWTLEMLTPSFYIYLRQINVNNVIKAENDYLKLLQNWEQTGNIKLEEQMLLKII